MQDLRVWRAAMTLREIAKKLQISKEMKAWNLGPKIADSDVAFLINGWVEAEAKAIRWEWRWQGGYGEGKTSVEIETLSVQKALRELDLVGVWPPQTHAPDCALALNARHDCSCGEWPPNDYAYCPDCVNGLCPAHAD